MKFKTYFFLFFALLIPVVGKFIYQATETYTLTITSPEKVNIRIAFSNDAPFLTESYCDKIIKLKKSGLDHWDIFILDDQGQILSSKTFFLTEKDLKVSINSNQFN